MKWLLSFLLFNVIKKNNVKKTITSHLNKESFVGSWVINENKKNQIIHFKPQGAIYKSGKKKSNYIGYWHTNENIFNFNLRDNNIEKKYYGKIYNNTLNISGHVCEGMFSPYFVSNFTMRPVFEQFHNITFVNNSDKFVYLNHNNVTGKWLLENTHTNKIYILELHLNNTWNSINFDYTYNKLSGKWNLFNETTQINTNSAIKSNNGKYIWLDINKTKNQSYVIYDIIFLGKIIQLGNVYCNKKKVIISSKINGSVVYGFDMEPEISEKFYMKRWFNN